MPLETQIERDGELLQLRWDGFHVGCMVYAVALETGKGPFTDPTPAGILGADIAAAVEADPGYVLRLGRACWGPFLFFGYSALALTPLNDGPYRLRKPWTFQDPEEGEILRLNPGDVLRAYRS